MVSTLLELDYPIPKKYCFSPRVSLISDKYSYICKTQLSMSAPPAFKMCGAWYLISALNLL